MVVEEQSNIEQTWAKYWGEGDQKAKDEIISHYLYIVNIVVNA
jgi:DNA-directed RNA polymerase specialized sigma subunit